jgi:hypothetical protein
MKAITIQHPHAFAAAAGLKPCENRGQRLTYRGTLALHAGLRFSPSPLPDPDAADFFARLGGPGRLWRPATASGPAAGPPLLAVGAVIAVAELVDCHPAALADGRVCCAPWGQQWHGAAARPAEHLILAAVQQLPLPVPCPGQQITPWTLPAEVAAAVGSQLAPA